MIPSTYNAKIKKNKIENFCPNFESAGGDATNCAIPLADLMNGCSVKSQEELKNFFKIFS